MRKVRVTRPARLGLVALAFIVAAVIALYLAGKLSRASGYEIAVRFPNAAGVAAGSQVYESGVAIGSVRQIQILPDASVDFIISIFQNTDIPKDARFSVQTSFTGTSKVTITPPEPHVMQGEKPTPLPPDRVLAKRILPLKEQPVGSAPLSLEAFMGQSRALGNRVTVVFSQAKPYGQRLQYHLQNARTNGAATTAQMREAQPALMGTMQSTIARAQANAAQAQGALRERNQAKVGAIARSFQVTLADMQRTSASMSALKRDPQMRANVQAASAQLKTVTGNLAKLSRDLEMITGNPQTKAQLRDAGGRFRRILRKL